MPLRTWKHTHWPHCQGCCPTGAGLSGCCMEKWKAWRGQQRGWRTRRAPRMLRRAEASPAG
eukprot:7524746-Alexandrium_andersonii.AAC.1